MTYQLFDRTIIGDREEAIGFITNILEASTEYSIIGTTIDGTILLWNAGARLIYGYEPREVIGLANAAMLYAPAEDTIHRLQHTFMFAQQQGKWEGMVQRVRKNGTTFPARVVITPRRNTRGEIIGFLTISKDFTNDISLAELKTVEHQLQEKNAELQVHYLQAQKANYLKSEFLANMSHEFRTPLNGIIGFTELLHDEILGQVTDEQKTCLLDILASSKHLLQLINDVLDLTKVEAGRMVFLPEPVLLDTLVKNVENLLRPQIANKRLQLPTLIDPALPIVVIDPAKFKQVLYNYLSNAIKFTPDEGKICIHIIADSADTFKLAVEDTGVGIQPKDIEHLFVAFQQLDSSSSKKYQGTGLGLALTKRLIEAQGGYVGVQSIPQKGSTFFAVLPRITETTLPTQQQQNWCLPEASPSSPSILIIDDDTNDQNRLARICSEAGYHIDIAATGAQALTICQQKRFTAITLDLILPDMDGWDVLRSIRTQPPNQHTAIIVTTMIKEKGVGAGFTIHDVLVKPIQAEEFLHALHRLKVPEEHL